MKLASEKRTFGVEIEAYNASRQQIIDALAAVGVRCESQAYNHTTCRVWKIVSDASVQGINAFELVSPVLSGEAGLNEVRKVCNALVSIDVKVNASCGLHVHHGARDYKVKNFVNIVNMYRRAEKQIDALMPRSRRDNVNVYCRSLITATTNFLMENRNNRDGERYYKLNLASFVKHGTIEFRQHNGTINADKVTAWIIFTQLIMERCKRKIGESGHDMTWYDTKQALGLVHNAELRDVADFFETRRQELALA